MTRQSLSTVRSASLRRSALSWAKAFHDGVEVRAVGREVEEAGFDRFGAPAQTGQVGRGSRFIDEDEPHECDAPLCREGAAQCPRGRSLRCL